MQASPSASRNATAPVTRAAAPIIGRRRSFRSGSSSSEVATRAAAPALNDVNDVGLKDAPLRSLFPEENPPPTDVSRRITKASTRLFIDGDGNVGEQTSTSTF